MLTVNRKSRQNLPHGRNHRQCASDKACLQVGALFSGLPKALRDEGLLMVLQAWFDESGKGQEPVYLLAGYVGKKTMWEDFADDWQTELDRKPRLPYLHANESQLFRGYTPAEKIERLLRFVAIIRKHQPTGITYMLKHEEYRQFFSVIQQHPTITPAERRMLKNPYYHSFTVILNVMLKAQAEKRHESGVKELIEVLIDDNTDKLQRLKLGFAGFVETVRKQNPEYLDLLINKDAETRDDKVFLPLQASDLLAWHLRRLCYEISRGNTAYQHDPIWASLRDGIEYKDYRHTEDQWVELLMRIRKDTFRGII
jgi:hypothetical protein